MSQASTRFSVPIRRGFAFEREFFGCSSEGVIRGPYEDFCSSFANVFLTQGEWSPLAPSTPFARRLFWYTIKHFPERERRWLGLYRAIGTNLDLWHHVDGFFYYGDTNSQILFDRRYRVTIDLAIWKQNSRADLCVEKVNIERADFPRIGGAIAAYLLGYAVLDELRTITST